MECRKNEFTISTDPDRLDITVIHNYLTRAYWSPGIPHDLVKKAVENSLSFGVYKDEDQIGFGRVVTDYTTTGYIADVFILEEYRGHGLGVWLIKCIMSHPDLQGFRKWMLVTKDAHSLYEKYGFRNLSAPEMYMEITRPNFYLQKE